MRLDFMDDGTLRVSLSRRNVAAALHKLDAGPRCGQIVSANAFMDHAAVRDQLLVLTAHEDGRPAANGVHGAVVVWSTDRHPSAPAVENVLVVDIARGTLAHLLRAARDGVGSTRATAGRFDLRVERDDAHYHGRPGPGRMRPETEERLAARHGGADETATTAGAIRVELRLPTNPLLG